MKLPSIPFLAEAFLNVLRRFPLVMLAATVGTVATMIFIENEHSTEADKFIKVILTCLLALAVMLCAKLVVEKWNLPMQWAILTQAIALGLVALYYFDLYHTQDVDDLITPVQFMGLNLVAHLGVAFIPYLDKSPVEDFWEYNKRLFGNFVVGAFYSLVLFAGLSIAIFAVDELFSLDINDKIFGHLFILIAGIFNTVYFLAHFPTDFDFSANNETSEPAVAIGHYTSSFKNLTKFILIPIIAVYFLILYAFSAKILVTWELPEGWVGKLVLGFSVAGIFTYLLNFMLVQYDKSLVVNGFRRWFFHILLPMVVLLFVAIGRRISDYGVTEARYVVATAGVWLLLQSLYFLVSRKDNIKVIPISLAFFTLITVIGPFSTFKVSERNQVGRLMAIFEKNGMLQDGKIVAPKDSLIQGDLEQIRGSFNYLTQNDHFGKIAPLFGLSTDSIPDWQATETLLQNIGVNPAIPTDYTPTCYAYFEGRQRKGITVSGYEELYQVYAYEKTKPETGFTGFQVSDGMGGLQFYENGEKADSFDLQPFLDKIEAAGVCNGKQVPDSLGIYEMESGIVRMMLILDNLTFRKGAKVKLVELNGRALLVKKQ